MEACIAALSTVIAAIVLWKVVFGIPLTSGYGVGQRKTEGVHTLFMTKKELMEFRKQRKPEEKEEKSHE